MEESTGSRILKQLLRKKMRTSEVQQMGNLGIWANTSSLTECYRRILYKQKSKSGVWGPMAGSAPSADHHMDTSWTKRTLLYGQEQKEARRKTKALCRQLQSDTAADAGWKPGKQKGDRSQEQDYSQLWTCKSRYLQVSLSSNSSYKQWAIKSIHSWRLEQPHLRVKSNEELNHTNK